MIRTITFLGWELVFAFYCRYYGLDSIIRLWTNLDYKLLQFQYLWFMQYSGENRLMPIDFNESEVTPFDWDWPQPATQQFFPCSFSKSISSGKQGIESNSTERSWWIPKSLAGVFTRQISKFLEFLSSLYFGWLKNCLDLNWNWSVPIVRRDLSLKFIIT